MGFDYFYGRGTEQFAFYQVPKMLITDDRFAGITMDSKFLYSLLLDRSSLSAKNGWLDEEGKVYIYYTLEQIMADMHCANQKATVNVSDSDFSEIPNGEQKILSLITARLLAALGAPAEITEYDLSVTCGGQIFTAKSKVMTKAGWKEIQDWILGSKTCEADDEDTEIEFSEKNSLKDVLAADPNLLSEGRTIPACDPQIKEGKTTPKKRFTESSLLSAMERAGADEIPDDAERKGLGTPATRAGIIEKLVRIGFLERKGDKKTKYLVPTHKGIALITVMPEAIQSPTMTAEWEQKLIEVEKQNFEAEEFMTEIQEMLTGLIQTYEIVKDAEVLMHPAYEPIGKCPACGADVIEKAFCYGWCVAALAETSWQKLIIGFFPLPIREISRKYDSFSGGEMDESGNTKETR